MKNTIFICPITRQKLIALDDGSLQAGKNIYRKEGNILLLNPALSDLELNNYYESVNSAKLLQMESDFFEGDFDPVERYYRRSRKAYLTELLPKNLGTAIDIGGGSGAILRSIIKTSGSVFDTLILADWAKSQMAPIAKAMDKDQRYVFVQADATRLPIDDNSIDFVFNSEMIEHLYPEQSEKMLAEFWRILKPGGKVLITTPNGSEYRRLLQESILSFWLLLKFINPRNMRERERLKGKIFRRYLFFTRHTFVNVDAAEKAEQIGHFNVLCPKVLKQQAQNSGLVVTRSEYCIFIPLIVPRALLTGKIGGSILDKIESACKRLKLQRLFLSCQMHLLEKPVFL